MAFHVLVILVLAVPLAYLGACILLYQIAPWLGALCFFTAGPLLFWLFFRIDVYRDDRREVAKAALKATYIDMFPVGAVYEIVDNPSLPQYNGRSCRIVAARNGMVEQELDDGQRWTSPVPDLIVSITADTVRFRISAGDTRIITLRVRPGEVRQSRGQYGDYQHVVCQELLRRRRENDA